MRAYYGFATTVLATRPTQRDRLLTEALTLARRIGAGFWVPLIEEALRPQKVPV